MKEDALCLDSPVCHFYQESSRIWVDLNENFTILQSRRSSSDFVPSEIKIDDFPLLEISKHMSVTFSVSEDSQTSEILVNKFHSWNIERVVVKCQLQRHYFCILWVKSLQNKVIRLTKHFRYSQKLFFLKLPNYIDGRCLLFFKITDIFQTTHRR